MQQGMVERFATEFGGLDEHLEILHHLLLPTEIVEAQRSQRILEILLGCRPFVSYVKTVH